MHKSTFPSAESQLSTASHPIGRRAPKINKASWTIPKGLGLLHGNLCRLENKFYIHQVRRPWVTPTTCGKPLAKSLLPEIPAYGMLAVDWHRPYGGSESIMAVFNEWLNTVTKDENLLGFFGCFKERVLGQSANVTFPYFAWVERNHDAGRPGLWQNWLDNLHGHNVRTTQDRSLSNRNHVHRFV